jgi:hypothetical protein
MHWSEPVQTCRIRRRVLNTLRDIESISRTILALVDWATRPAYEAAGQSKQGPKAQLHSVSRPQPPSTVQLHCSLFSRAAATKCRIRHHSSSRAPLSTLASGERHSTTPRTRETPSRAAGPKVAAVASTVDAGKLKAYPSSIKGRHARRIPTLSTKVPSLYCSLAVYTMALLRGRIASVSACVAALLLVCLVQTTGAYPSTAA